MSDVVLVDFPARVVFRRRPNPNRPGAVLVEAASAGRRSNAVELGVVTVEAGRPAWIRNPDADDRLIEHFQTALRAAHRHPADWALQIPENSPRPVPTSRPSR